MGVERERENENHGNATLLGYVGPEISLSIAALPHWEFAYRLHHRSGAHGRIGNMGEGANANVIGLKYRF